MDFRRRLIDLADQRTNALTNAENALAAGNTAEYDSAMEKVTNLNAEISRVQNLLAEQQRKAVESAPTGAEARDMAEERGEALRRGDFVNFSAVEVIRSVRNATTLASGTLVMPSGAGETIRDPIGNDPSSIVNQVNVQDLTGMESYSEAYVISELTAKGGKVSTNAGKARGASDSPTFGVAKISPYELTVTDYVDRNISRLTPANYYAKIYNMAMRAMYRKLAELIVNGDGQAIPDMYGIKTAKNKAGANIFATANVSAINENLLDTFFYAYGSDAAIGANARLYLAKDDLKALGMLRNNDKERVFKVHPEAGNPNIGTIEDGGVFHPYTIVPDLTALSKTVAGASPVQTMLYGDPMNFMLGLFGTYSVRVDESIKGEERMLTILGDAMVGGNLVVDKGFVVGTVPKSGS